MLRPLFDLITNSFFKKYEDKSIEKILLKSFEILDKQTLNEIETKTTSFVTAGGAFCDRACKSDLYYSLFGMFVWEPFNQGQINQKLKVYIQNIDFRTLEDVHFFSYSIIFSRLKADFLTKTQLKRHLKKLLSNRKTNSDYQLFMGFLALYYLQDYLGIFNLLSRINPGRGNNDLPCPVRAAELILAKIKGLQTIRLQEQIMQFFYKGGSFKALKNSHTGDLLSTAVALFALKFADADLRSIKPACLEYIDSLYSDGSFTATQLDNETDIEYTFYGLLALGSLA